MIFASCSEEHPTIIAKRGVMLHGAEYDGILKVLDGTAFTAHELGMLAAEVKKRMESRLLVEAPSPLRVLPEQTPMVSQMAWLQGAGCDDDLADIDSGSPRGSSLL